MVEGVVREMSPKGMELYSKVGRPSIVGLYVITALLPFIVPDIPVGTDLYKHLMAARVLANYGNSLLGYYHYFQICWRPVPTALGDLTLTAFVKVFSPIAALKAYFIVFAAGLAWTGSFYLRRVGLPGCAVILILPLLHSFYVFSGFLPFIGSLVLYPLLLGVMTGTPAGPYKFVCLTLILVGLYGFHIVGAVVGCFSVAVCALNLRKLSFLGLVSSHSESLLVILPSSGLIVYYAATKIHDTGRPLFHTPLGQIKAYIGYNVWSLSPIASWLFALFLAFLAGTVLWHIHAGRIVHNRLLLLSVMLVIIGCFMPYQVGAEFVVGPRTLPFALIAAVGALKWDARLFRASVVLSCVFVAISAASNTSNALAVQTSYRVFLSGTDAIKPGSKVLPIIEDLTLGGNQYIQPFSSIEDLYNIYRGGSNPYVFAEPYVGTGANLLRAKYAFKFLSKYTVHEPIDYRRASEGYDYIICWGRLPTIKPEVATAAPLVFESGLLSIYRVSTSL